MQYVELFRAALWLSEPEPEPLRRQQRMIVSGTKAITSGPRLGEQGIRAVIHHGRSPRSHGGSRLLFRQLLPRCLPLPPQLCQLRLRCGPASQPWVSFRH